MSLMRQVWLLILSVVVLACLGSVVVSVWGARSYLESQLTLKNNDNAQALALTLTQQAADPALIELALAAQFDTGSYRIIRFRDGSGQVRFERLSGNVPVRAPSWFVRAVPIEAVPGLAHVSNGWNALGTVEVESLSVFAYADLWRSAQQTALWMVALGIAAVGVGTWGVRRLRRPLDAVVQQAEAVSQRRFIRIEEPAVPELQRVTHAMNTMVERVHRQFLEQAAQLSALQTEAHTDPTTGVSHRNHFLARMKAELASEHGLAHGQLMLVRVLKLTEGNQALGHPSTDQALARLVRVFNRTDVQAVGRLNGADFALLLAPVDDPGTYCEMVAEEARGVLAPYAPISTALSMVSWRKGDEVGTLLALADAALARAEVRGDFSCETINDKIDEWVGVGGEESWRRGIQSAVADQRVRLMAFPVVDRKGRLLHQECPLRLQLHDAGEHLPASYWLPLALRTGVTAAVDEFAVKLGLEANERDGVARAVNISVASLETPGFTQALFDRLSRRPAAARLLLLEIDATAMQMHAAVVHDLCRRLRPLGVQVGLEHAGERVEGLRSVLETGVDFVKLASSLGHGLGDDDKRRELLRGTVQMLHNLDVSVYMEGVAEPDALPWLWDCGLDGVTGPAISAS